MTEILATMAPITPEETLSTSKTSPASPKGGKRTVAKASPSKSKKQKRPRGLPKKPLSAYNLFFQDVKVEENNKERQGQSSSSEPFKFSAFSNLVSTKWQSLDPEKRNMYYEKAEKEKEKYAKAMSEWYSRQHSLHNNNTYVGNRNSSSVASGHHANGSLPAPSKSEAQSLTVAGMNSSPTQGPAYNSKRFIPPPSLISPAGGVADKVRMNQMMAAVSNSVPAQGPAFGSKRFGPPSSLVPSFGAAAHKTRMNRMAAADVSNSIPTQDPAFGSKRFVPPSSLVPSIGALAAQKRMNHRMGSAISNSTSTLAQDPAFGSEMFVLPPSLSHSDAAHQHPSSRLPVGSIPSTYEGVNNEDDRTSKLRSLVAEARKERLVSEACQEYYRRDYLKRRSELMALAEMYSDEPPVRDGIERGDTVLSSVLNEREHLGSVPLASAMHNRRERHGSVPSEASLLPEEDGQQRKKPSDGKPRNALLVTYSIIPMP